MKARLLDHLVCPLDKTPLECLAWETIERPLSTADRGAAATLGLAPAALEREIVSGVLVNRARQIYYPIQGGVPRMLVFSTGVAEAFHLQHGERLCQELPGFAPPREPAQPGEQDVLRTFSNEWTNYEWNERAYWSQTAAAWFRNMRFALDLDRQPLRGKLILEAGIGIGGTADYVARSEGCELVGIDLGYAVDAAQRNFGANAFLHLVQASVFALPFRERTFDFAYSFGVIHHTFSTPTAFASLARMPKLGGRLYVWVYSFYDEQRHLGRRVLMFMERGLRPIVWRMPEKLQTVAIAPLVPLYMAYQKMRVWRHGGGSVAYGWREALHAARDRFTPRYIHRHTDAEVCDWFHQAGYEHLTCDSGRERPDDVPTHFTSCTGVSGVRVR
ncbi:MAG TPA: methyltransferase domain-containing protein [Pirellulales bacterium]|jgi:uncharacterized protein YbaR (Trm112 family)/SAM-dependent methyltransferase|nr:methyltransferase domain-containing protein [Pirellulales bacterium]